MKSPIENMGLETEALACNTIIPQTTRDCP
jgi:hypothetical protein